MNKYTVIIALCVNLGTITTFLHGMNRSGKLNLDACIEHALRDVNDLVTHVCSGGRKDVEPLFVVGEKATPVEIVEKAVEWISNDPKSHFGSCEIIEHFIAPIQKVHAVLIKKIEINDKALSELKETTTSKELKQKLQINRIVLTSLVECMQDYQEENVKH